MTNTTFSLFTYDLEYVKIELIQRLDFNQKMEQSLQIYKVK